MKIVISHPTGNTNLRAAVSAFYKAKFLNRFITTIAVFPNSFFAKLGMLPPFKDILRRSYSMEILPFTNSFMYREIGRLVFSKFLFLNFLFKKGGYFSIDEVYMGLDRKVAGLLSDEVNSHVDAVYCYEDGALETFISAKSKGLKCIYDLPTGYWLALREVLQLENEINPEWVPTLTGFLDSEEKLRRKDSELELADLVLVASDFTKSSLQKYAKFSAEIRVVPYGYPTPFLDRKYKPLLKGQKLKILFVGKLTQQKGLSTLFESVHALKEKVDLTLVGKKPVEDCQVLNSNLSLHTHISSLPNHEILLLMRSVDLLIFPSLFDGFGLVITEAMSQGTPVIASNRSAGPDLIDHGVNGWVFNAGKTNELVGILESIIEEPGLLESAGRNALKSASERPWSKYQDELIHAVTSIA